MRLSRQGESLIVHTPAKLNLTLKVLGKRPDGFHDLETLMVSIGLYDTLRFTPRSDSELSLRPVGTGRLSSDIPFDDTNLIVRAARLLQEHTGRRFGVNIRLDKRIPSQAGLGGGSSDAAATLAALNTFWKLGLPVEDLHPLAARLGSDVNFFLDSPSAAICTGRGERVRPIRMRQPLHFVVIKPATGLSTGKVFQSLLKSPEESRLFPDSMVDSLEQAPFAMISRLIRNDLESAGRSLNPDVDRILESLTRDEIPAAMTGSGSACFGLCQTDRQARTLAARCRACSGDEVFAVRSAA